MGVIGHYILKAILGESVVETSAGLLVKWVRIAPAFGSDWLWFPRRVLWG